MSAVIALRARRCNVPLTAAGERSFYAARLAAPFDACSLRRRPNDYEVVVKPHQTLRLFLAALLIVTSVSCGGGSSAGTGAGADGAEFCGESCKQNMGWFLRWHEITLDATGKDHVALAAADQYGPTRASRALAIVHIAMFDVVNAFSNKYQSYLHHDAPPRGASMKAALSTAAKETLQFLFPSQEVTFEHEWEEDMNSLENSRTSGVESGAAFGKEVASAVILARTGDGSELCEHDGDVSYSYSVLPGHWREDPLNPFPPHGNLWSKVTPFVMTHAAQFRPGPPPALESKEYAEAVEEAYRVGGDGVTTPTERTDEQTIIGIFWAYDGTPNLCAPPRMFNQIVRKIVAAHGPEDMLEVARLFALVNVALADTAISVWDAKFFYDFWRPVTAIREADPGTGPTGLGDGNELTVGDPDFVPLGSPASNLGAKGFTPPFPTYPSGHGGFAGAVFELLKRFYGTDEVPFSIVSDEYNGTTTNEVGDPRPRVERHYNSLSEAANEAGESRIYLGIHFRFDKDAALAEGRAVGAYVWENIFRPLEPPQPPSEEHQAAPA